MYKCTVLYHKDKKPAQQRRGKLRRAIQCVVSVGYIMHVLWMSSQDVFNCKVQTTSPDKVI